MHRENLKMIDYCHEFGLETAKMWRLSFQRALGLREHDRCGEMSEQLNYSQHFDTALSRVTIDVRTSQIGSLTTRCRQRAESIPTVDYQRALIGKKLLDDAKAPSLKGLPCTRLNATPARNNFICLKVSSKPREDSTALTEIHEPVEERLGEHQV